MSAPDRPIPTGGPWTRHGHPIPGVTVAGGRPPAVARCGGPALCRKCREDVAQAGDGLLVAPDRPTLEQRAGIKEIATYDSGYVWPIRASEVFVEDTLLCGASLLGGQMCIRRLGADLQCPRHGQRKATRRTPPGTSAPLPAVPDGEGARLDAAQRWLREVDGPDAAHADAIIDLVDGLLTEREDLHDQLPDGEDVPARLDAAAEALASLGWSGTSEELRHISFLLKHDDAAEVRAAVAAALARPTGDVR